MKRKKGETDEKDIEIGLQRYYEFFSTFLNTDRTNRLDRSGRDLEAAAGRFSDLGRFNIGPVVGARSGRSGRHFTASVGPEILYYNFFLFNTLNLKHFNLESLVYNKQKHASIHTV
ncbi:hypothetical protein HanRHA438_Chr12g0569311 [Helianthus annuus]|nr:hypothetical protein HanRHA438_Chr12g0569311 [Helianthus annuus]